MKITKEWFIKNDPIKNNKERTAEYLEKEGLFGLEIKEFIEGLLEKQLWNCAVWFDIN